MPRRIKRPKSVKCCGGWLMFFTIAFFVIFFVLVFAVPSDSIYVYRDEKTSVLSKVIRSECTESEQFDVDLRMCVPKLILPEPISESLKDHKIEPCSSFYHHSCGNWIRNHTNEDRAFTYVYRKNMKRIQQIVSTPSSGAPYLLYRSCIDTLVYNQHKINTKMEIKHLYDHILARLRSHQDLPMIFGRLAKYGYTGPFSLSIESHPTKPRMIPLIQATKLPIIDISMIADITLEDVALLQELINTLAVNSEATLDDSSYVEYIKTQFDDDVWNITSFGNDEFWKQYFIELGGSNLEHDLLLNKEVWVPSKDHAYISHMLLKMNSIPIEQWIAYVKYSIVYNSHNFMPLLPSDSYYRTHDYSHHTERLSEHSFYGTRVQDTIQEKHCVSLVNTMLPGMMAKVYLDKFMPENERIRSKITEMATDIRNAYSNLIEATEWLTPKTRALAKEKISNIIIRAVHPNVWETEPFQSRISKTRYVSNLNLIRQYRVQRNLQLWSLYKETQGRDSIQRFGAPLTTVNAYYSPVTNTITIFAGITTAPFFHLEYSPVSLYATIGMIIGHELSHAMDNNGRLFDLEGSLTDWWTEADVEGFKSRAQCIIAEYGPPQGCENVNYGKQTLGEDIADITGITLALNAYESRHGISTESRRKFFTIFSQMWAESYDQRHLCNRVDSDVHAVAWFRVDKTLRQLDAFRTAFDCSKETQMVHKNKCKIYG